MPRLHSESSRSYPGRSAQRGDRVVTRKPTGDVPARGYRLTKSRRYRERIRPIPSHETKGANRKAFRVITAVALHGATREVIGQKSAEAIVAKRLL